MNKIYRYLLAIAALTAAGFGIYEYTVSDKYQYWKELITKDPKPGGVSEQEYRERFRAGYCWRGRKLYTPGELRRKAMVNFTGRLLRETEAYKANMTTNQGGRDCSTGADCVRHEKACGVWFVPQDYTNEQWDSMSLAEEDPTDETPLAKYPEKEIRQKNDLKNYLKRYGNRGFILILRGPSRNGANVYDSDYCTVLSKKEAEPMIRKDALIAYLEGTATSPENGIPQNINIQNYGVGNFYFKSTGIDPDLHRWNISKEKTYQRYATEILLINNCRNVLWQPFYVK